MTPFCPNAAPVRANSAQVTTRTATRHPLLHPFDRIARFLRCLLELLDGSRILLLGGGRQLGRRSAQCRACWLIWCRDSLNRKFSMIRKDPPWYQAANGVWDSRRIEPITPSPTERRRAKTEPQPKLGRGKSMR